MSSSVEDLSAIARRRTLTLPEARRLEVALKSAPDARILHEAGRDYDASSTEAPGDVELVERLANRAVLRLSRARVVRERIEKARHRRFAPLAVAVLLCGAAATAGTWGVRTLRGIAPPAILQPQTQPERRAPLPSSPPAKARENATSIQAIPSATRVEPPPVPVPTPRGASAELRVPGTSSSPQDDAASLFAAANAERKMGNVAGALRSYDELERRFPDSAEARLSHVLAARLLLRRGDFAGGLAHFDSYLAANRNGTLAEEALQGRAEALRALGRATEERQALQELLTRFPNSIQARAAKERLASPP